MKLAIQTTCSVALLLGGLLCTNVASAQSKTGTDGLPEAPGAGFHAAAEGGSSVSRAASEEPVETTTFVFPDTLQAIGQGPAAKGSAEGARTRAREEAASVGLRDCPTGLLRSFMFLSQKQRAVCQEQDPLQFIVEPGPIRPLTPRQKALLAGRAVIEPFNLATIVAFSGISVAANARSAYGPGLHGWGLLIGYSLVEDMQGEFTGTFLIPTLVHEDPRYHRLPGHMFGQRLLHAIGHTVLSQHDDGSIMPNYATLINYPLSAEISNLYVPGVATNAPSTAKRIALGYATDPVGAIVAEFLPDVAKRVHIHILFAQQILNQIALGQPTAQQ